VGDAWGKTYAVQFLAWQSPDLGRHFFRYLLFKHTYIEGIRSVDWRTWESQYKNETQEAQPSKISKLGAREGLAEFQAGEVKPIKPDRVFPLPPQNTDNPPAGIDLA
jgi:hypothetical protein